VGLRLFSSGSRAITILLMLINDKTWCDGKMNVEDSGASLSVIEVDGVFILLHPVVALNSLLAVVRTRVNEGWDNRALSYIFYKHYQKPVQRKVWVKAGEGGWAWHVKSKFGLYQKQKTKDITHNWGTKNGIKLQTFPR